MAAANPPSQAALEESRTNIVKSSTTQAEVSDKKPKGKKQNRDAEPKTGQGRPNGERPRRTSAAFDAFYKANLVETGVIESSEEYERFIDCLNRPLPSTLWVTPTAKDAAEVRSTLREYQNVVESRKSEISSGASADVLSNDSAGITNKPASDRTCEEGGEPLDVSPLRWLPDGMGWRVDVPKTVLRKDPRFKPLHQMLIEHTARGTINRMEEVSMLPATLLDVRAGHRCLDMCASPGNKTAQMVSALAEANFRKWGRGLEDICAKDVAECQPSLCGRIDYGADEGCVIANDLSVERSGMLVHQVARHQHLYPLVLFTSHDARYFPSIRSSDGSELRFDRILCDVMCSSDGTMRKSPHLWREWTAKHSLELHRDQLAVALRAARLLKVGGRMVYSTCSMSPVENEAVVAEILRCTDEALELVDTREMVQPLRTCCGMRRWRVAHPSSRKLSASYADAIAADGPHRLLHPSNFAPDDDTAISKALPRCIRVLPHHNDTGGFFIAVFEKKAETRRREVAPQGSQDRKDVASDTAATGGLVPESPLTFAYDSDVDSDGEERSRRAQLERLEEAVASGRSEQERAKAVARRERARTSGTLARELARYGRFMDDAPDSEKSLRSFYGLHSRFPMDLLFCRYHLQLNAEGAQVQTHDGEANQLILCSRGVADLLVCGTSAHAKRKLKVLAGGLRAFERDRFEVAARASQFRFGQEAMELMLPYVGERVVSLDDMADTRRLFASGRTAPIASLASEQARADLESLPPGGCVLLLRTLAGDRVPVAALRTHHSVSAYVSDLAVPALRKACGLPPTDEVALEAKDHDGATVAADSVS